MADELRVALDDAEARESCLVPSTTAVRNRLDHLTRRGELARVQSSAYARAAHWDGLDAARRAMCRIRALATLHPDWVFCGASAALVHGLSVSYRSASRIEVATRKEAPCRSTRNVGRHVIGRDERTVVAGVRVSTLERTVYDCLRRLDFRGGLALADSALRVTGKPREWLTSLFAAPHKGARGIKHARVVASYADGRAESGGESIARGAMIELGFMLPELQVEVPDPLEPWHGYRVDFAWAALDGATVFGEFDGREKYRNPRMTQGRDAVDVFADERLRESRISAQGARILRFSFADLLDDQRFSRLLVAYGVPRVDEPGRIELRPGHRDWQPSDDGSR